MSPTKQGIVIEARNAVMPFVAEGWRTSSIESIDGILTTAIDKSSEDYKQSLRDIMADIDDALLCLCRGISAESYLKNAQKTIRTSARSMGLHLS